MNMMGKKTFPTLNEVILLLGSCFILLYILAMPLQKWNLRFGLLVTQLVIFLACPFLMMLMFGVRFKTTFRLARPPVKAMVMPIFIAPALIFLLSELMVLQNLYLPAPEYYREAIKRLGSEPGNPFEFIQVIILISLLPGICEELMFRGVVLSGMLQKLSAARSIILAAVVFGAFHLSPYHFMPVFLIGLVLGYITVRTGSIFPAMFVHVLYNAVAFSVREISGPAAVSWLGQTDHVPVPILVVSGVVLLVSLLMLPQSRPRNLEAASV